MRTNALLFTTVALLISPLLMAQNQITVMGHVTPCGPATAVYLQTVQGTQPAISQAIQTNENCYYSVTLDLESSPGWIQVSSSCNNGTAANNSGSYTQPVDTLVLDITCNSGPVGDCVAGFEVMQGMDSGSPAVPGEPIPNEVWIIDNSTSAYPPLTHAWSFGDGNTSMEATPIHTYGSAGEYLLCLTIGDANGCSSIHCDTVAVDNDGMLAGMAPGGDVRNGFILRVFSGSELGMAVDAPDAAPALVLWPNPADDILNVTCAADQRGHVIYSVIDALGREVAHGDLPSDGSGVLQVPTRSLEKGNYLLKVMVNGGKATTHRFVKQ
jgi:hypothetical protein